MSKKAWIDMVGGCVCMYVCIRRRAASRCLMPGWWGKKQTLLCLSSTSSSSSSSSSSLLQRCNAARAANKTNRSRAVEQWQDGYDEDGDDEDDDDDDDDDANDDHRPPVYCLPCLCILPHLPHHGSRGFFSRCRFETLLGKGEGK